MKSRKSRTAINRRWNKWLENHNHKSECDYFDGFTDNGHPEVECNAPWSNKCKGNVFECAKLKYKYFASSKK